MNKYDLIIIGGGIAGLSTAYFAAKAGMKVAIFEAGQIGSGASGGLVGAMACHMPESWNPKKQYQFEALQMAQNFWPMIEAESGLTTGYQRIGRVMAISNARDLEKAQLRKEAAKTSWQGQAEWKVKRDSAPFAKAPFGTIYETLSAKLNPRSALAALAKMVNKMGVEIFENHKVRDISAGKILANEVFAASHILIAGGHDSWPFLRRYLGAEFGEGIKGQAALLTPEATWRYPMLTGDGFYIVPHSPDRIAIGSTSERYWQHRRVDHQLDHLLDKIRRDIPELKSAKIVEKWAGIRPRAYRPDPLIGEIAPHVFVFNGNFKTGFSFAPKLAEDLVALMEGKEPIIPKGFLPV